MIARAMWLVLQKYHSGRYQSALANGPCVGASNLLARTAESRAFPDPPFTLPTAARNTPAIFSDVVGVEPGTDAVVSLISVSN